LVAVPPVVARDPASVLLVDPQVPEERRFCASCEAEVGRSRPGRPEGFCPACGHPYSFTPKLVAGDLVGQYRVAGCLAHGGLGWIYLATDENVSNRWVVLKGLLNTGDPAAAAAAVAEQRFLAEVEHPNIVKIYNAVRHGDDAYIVMEYVGGPSLKGILAERRAAAGKPDPLPPDQAIAYLVEILPAFRYLHENGLLFCDFKPDNVIQTAEALKLIDLGAVVRVTDLDGDIYGTVGYQAPEIATAGPSVASDLYTVGRTLAVLATDFRGYQSTYRHSLPERAEVELYQRFESLYRLLQRATATEPADRFGSADELSDQLLGVLREVLAAQGEPSPAPSRLFTGELGGEPSRPDWRTLPVPLPDLEDPGAGYLTALTVTAPADVLRVIDAAPVRSRELACRAVRALLDGAAAGVDPPVALRQAGERLAAAGAEFGWDWRLRWYAGLLGLAIGRAADAAVEFDKVYAWLPGELAPKLALATAAELAGNPERAAELYDTVSRTDPAFTTACAGLARCRHVGGDRAGAAEAFARIPTTSAVHAAGRVAAVRGQLAPGAGPADLARAHQLMGGLDAGPEQLAELRADLLTQVLAAVTAGAPVPTELAGPGERGLRLELEGCYRLLGRAARGADRIRLVDLANTVRPRTLW
jgi:serine/threonine-protein kinase PknG